MRSASGCFNAPSAPMETVKRRPSHCAFVEIKDFIKIERFYFVVVTHIRYQLLCSLRGAARKPRGLHEPYRRGS